MSLIELHLLLLTTSYYTAIENSHEKNPSLLNEYFVLLKRLNVNVSLIPLQHNFIWLSNQSMVLRNFHSFLFSNAFYPPKNILSFFELS